MKRVNKKFTACFLLKSDRKCHCMSLFCLIQSEQPKSLIESDCKIFINVPNGRLNETLLKCQTVFLNTRLVNPVVKMLCHWQQDPED